MGTPARGTGRGGPARGYRWENFAPGNLANLQHGSRSERVIAAVAERERLPIPTDLPGLASHVLARLVEAQSRTQARVVLVHEHLKRVGELDDSGEPRSAARHLTSLERLNREHLAAIVRVVADLATAGTQANLADELARGRALREAAEARARREAWTVEDDTEEPEP